MPVNPIDLHLVSLVWMPPLIFHRNNAIKSDDSNENW